MNKKNLIDSLAGVLSTKKEARDAVEKIFSEMRKSLREGDRIAISGLGTFSTFVAKAKKGRNPNTGQSLQISPRKKVRFKQSADFFK